MRYHPKLDQIGMSIMNARTNGWIFEIRNKKDLSPIWQTVLPMTRGDCEVTPFIDQEWLIINSCGIRLLQISGHRFKVAVEYERELKNAIAIGNDYFAIRTKNTLDVHSMKEKNDSIDWRCSNV